jgi:hypothetical protein
MIDLPRTLMQATVLAVAEVASMALFEVGEVEAQSADTASAPAATAGAPPASAFATPGKQVQATYSTSPPSPMGLNPTQRRAFEAAFAKANRSGPTDLPLATMRAIGPVGPSTEVPRRQAHQAFSPQQTR